MAVWLKRKGTERGSGGGSYKFSGEIADVGLQGRSFPYPPFYPLSSKDKEQHNLISTLIWSTWSSGSRRQLLQPSRRRFAWKRDLHLPEPASLYAANRISRHITPITNGVDLVLIKRGFAWLKISLEIGAAEGSPEWPRGSRTLLEEDACGSLMQEQTSHRLP